MGNWRNLQFQKVIAYLLKSQWYNDFVKALKCNFCQYNNNTSWICQTQHKSKYPLRSYGFELFIFYFYNNMFVQ